MDSKQSTAERRARLLARVEEVEKRRNDNAELRRAHKRLKARKKPERRVPDKDPDSDQVV